jgi:2-polyprenyl-3-methyl-5-hydroxy-6-metoxy-1,4-benzoquinol methylase
MKNTRTIKIPFFYGAQDNKNNGGKPTLLRFEYFYDRNLKLYCNLANNNLREILNNIYLSGSMLNGEMNSLDGGHQGKAALDFVYNLFPDLKSMRVLELGCGNGYLLKELNKRGATCYGLEPGPQIQDVIESNKEIEIIKDFFPSSKIEGKFDLILHFNVLEHLENPVKMLKEQAELLKPNGKIIVGVPNCEPNLKTGDISIFMHEHFNYFTRDSFNCIAIESGLVVDSIITGASNGMIFCSLAKQSINYPYVDSEINWSNFDNKIKNCLNNLKNKLYKYQESDIAVYCPKRALNALSMLNISNCRFIDDTPEMLGKYMPSFSNCVEDFTSLVNNPPKILIIFSRTFGDIILTKCKKNKELNNTEIILLESFD